MPSGRQIQEQCARDLTLHFRYETDGRSIQVLFDWVNAKLQRLIEQVLEAERITHPLPEWQEQSVAMNTTFNPNTYPTVLPNGGGEYLTSPVHLVHPANGQPGDEALWPAIFREKSNTGLPTGQRPFEWATCCKVGGKFRYYTPEQIAGWCLIPVPGGVGYRFRYTTYTGANRLADMGSYGWSNEYIDTLPAFAVPTRMQEIPPEQTWQLDYSAIERAMTAVRFQQQASAPQPAQNLIEEVNHSNGTESTS